MPNSWEKLESGQGFSPPVFHMFSPKTPTPNLFCSALPEKQLWPQLEVEVDPNTSGNLAPGVMKLLFDRNNSSSQNKVVVKSVPTPDSSWITPVSISHLPNIIATSMMP